jgi:hypothetical protein
MFKFNTFLRIGLVLPVLLIASSSFGMQNNEERKGIIQHPVKKNNLDKECQEKTALLTYQDIRANPTFDPMYLGKLNGAYRNLSNQNKYFEIISHREFKRNYIPLRAGYQGLTNTDWFFRAGSVATAAFCGWFFNWFTPSDALSFEKISTTAFWWGLSRTLFWGITGGVIIKTSAFTTKQLLRNFDSETKKTEAKFQTELVDLAKKYPIKKPEIE